MHSIDNLVTIYKEKIYRTCYYFSGTDEDAKDLCQEIFMIIIEKLPTFQNRSSIGTWIYRISINTCLIYKRKKRYHINIDDTYLGDLAEDNSIIAIKKLEEEQFKLLHEKISLLPLLDKLISILYLQDCSYEEISQIAGISISNVGVRINRIKSKIRIQVNKI